MDYKNRVERLFELSGATLCLGAAMIVLITWLNRLSPTPITATVSGPSLPGWEYLAFMVLMLIGLTIVVLLVKRHLRALLTIYTIGVIGIVCLQYAIYGAMGLSLVWGMGLAWGILLFAFTCGLFYFSFKNGNNLGSILLGGMLITDLAISVNSITLIILLVFFSIYDVIAVNYLKSMTKMAHAAMFEEKEGKKQMIALPMLFIVGERKGDFSTLNLNVAQKREVSALGLGDVALPGALILSFMPNLWMMIPLTLLWFVGLGLDFYWAKKTEKAIPALPIIVALQVAFIGLSVLL